MSDSDNPRVFVPPPLMFALAVGAGIILDGNALSWSFGGRPAQLAGAAVALAGLFLILVSLNLFRRFRTRPEPWEPSSTLILTGVYRFTRNPMYLGMALLSVGIAVFFESLLGCALVAAVVVAIDRIVIAREERYLLRRFGEDYAGYQSRVRRWL